MLTPRIWASGAQLWGARAWQHEVNLKIVNQSERRKNGRLELFWCVFGCGCSINSTWAVGDILRPRTLTLDLRPFAIFFAPAELWPAASKSVAQRARAKLIAKVKIKLSALFFPRTWKMAWWSKLYVYKYEEKNRRRQLLARATVVKPAATRRCEVHGDQTLKLSVFERDFWRERLLIGWFNSETSLTVTQATRRTRTRGAAISIHLN